MLGLFSALVGLSLVSDALNEDSSRRDALGDDDPYHARDFSDEYDFFDAHMDDFGDDFEEAADYYYDHE